MLVEVYSAAAAPTSPCGMRSCVIALKVYGTVKVESEGHVFIFQHVSRGLHLYFISSSSWKKTTLYFVQTSIKRLRYLSALVNVNYTDGERNEKCPSFLQIPRQELGGLSV